MRTLLVAASLLLLAAAQENPDDLICDVSPEGTEVGKLGNLGRSILIGYTQDIRSFLILAGIATKELARYIDANDPST